MLAPAESIYDGTWGGGPPPQEWVDFEILREMKWTWRELQETPLYVRRYVFDLIMLRRQAEHDAVERAREEGRRGRS